MSRPLGLKRELRRSVAGKRHAAPAGQIPRGTVPGMWLVWYLSTVQDHSGWRLNPVRPIDGKLVGLVFWYHPEITCFLRCPRHGERSRSSAHVRKGLLAFQETPTSEDLTTVLDITTTSAADG